MKDGDGQLLTAAQLAAGPSISPLGRLRLYSDQQWEEFIHEWAFSCLKSQYKQVQRASGANDKGIDIAGFRGAKMLNGVWDNYQCKHYNHPLMPSDAWIEFGKTLWYSFSGEYRPPRAYYFVAPQEVGSTLAHYLANSEVLKAQLLINWDKYCRDDISSTPVLMEGKFAKFVDDFDFSIFKSKGILEILEQFKKTPHYVKRFGGGLPPRPKPGVPPAAVAPEEAIYVSELLKTYGS